MKICGSSFSKIDCGNFIGMSWFCHEMSAFQIVVSGAFSEIIGWQRGVTGVRIVECYHVCVVIMLSLTQPWVFSGSLLGVVLLFFMQPIRSHLLLFSSTLLLHSCQSSLTKQGRGDFKRICCLVFFPPLLSFWSLRNYRGAGMTTQGAQRAWCFVCVHACVQKKWTAGMVNAVCVFVCSVCMWETCTVYPHKITEKLIVHDMWHAYDSCWLSLHMLIYTYFSRLSHHRLKFVLWNVLIS